jgi:hypothetical protein
MNNTELRLEVLSYDDEYIYALEVGNDPYELVINSYYDEDDIVKFTKDEEFIRDEVFLYNGEPYLVTDYISPTDTIYATRIGRAVSISLLDIEITEEFDDFYDYYVKEEVILYNVQ